jgi:hypothetical protein
LRQKYVWPNMRKDILSWCHTWISCQCAKVQRHNRNTPNIIEDLDHRFDHIHLDIVTLPTVQEYRYCLTMIDRRSHWPEAIPMKEMTAESVVSAFFMHWISFWHS